MRVTVGGGEAARVACDDDGGGWAPVRICRLREVGQGRRPRLRATDAIPARVDWAPPLSFFLLLHLRLRTTSDTTQDTPLATSATRLRPD